MTDPRRTPRPRRPASFWGDFVQMDPLFRGWVLAEREGVENESGVIIAARADGDELLFAGESGAPLRWIPVTQFVVDPATVRAEDEEH